MKRIFELIKSWAHRPAFRFLVSLLAAADIFLCVVPTDALLVAAVRAHPRKWIWSVALISCGSAAGALAMAVAIRWIGWLPPVSEAIWDHCTLYSLAAVAAGPFPLQPAALAAGFSKMTVVLIFAATWAGRLPKYLLFGWLALRIRGVRGAA